MLSFITAIPLLLFYEFSPAYQRAVMERVVKLTILASLSFLFLLFLQKMLWRTVRRSWSRFQVRRAYKKLFRQAHTFDFGNRCTIHLHTILLRRLTRHLSEFVEDAEEPEIDLVRRYAEDTRDKLQKHD